MEQERESDIDGHLDEAEKYFLALCRLFVASILECFLDRLLIDPKQ